MFDFLDPTKLETLFQRIAGTPACTALEGDWDKAGACPKKRPYMAGEKALGYTESEMRKTVVEAVRTAADATGAVSGWT
jgi:hypothetical protein